MTAKKLPVHTATMRNGFTLDKQLFNGKCMLLTGHSHCCCCLRIAVVSFTLIHVLDTDAWRQAITFFFQRCVCVWVVIRAAIVGMHSNTTYDISALHNENDQSIRNIFGCDREEFMRYMARILWQCALHGTSKAGQNKQRWTSNEVKCTESVTCFASIGIDQCA